MFVFIIFYFFCVRIFFNKETLEVLKKMKCKMTHWTCAFAALRGQLETLQWLRANGCDWKESTCNFAASKGFLNVVVWARQNGCECSSWTCGAASEYGHLEVCSNDYSTVMDCLHSFPHSIIY